MGPVSVTVDTNVTPDDRTFAAILKLMPALPNCPSQLPNIEQSRAAFERDYPPGWQTAAVLCDQHGARTITFSPGVRNARSEVLMLLDRMEWDNGCTCGCDLRERFQPMPDGGED